jgi:MFS family permease
MAGCEVIPGTGADSVWGLKRVLLGWGGLGATIGAASALSAALLGGLGMTVGIGLLGAVGGFFIGVGIGHAVEWFSRLKDHNPSTITVAGCIICAGKNTGFPPFNDNDWTFNVGNLRVTNPTNLSVNELRTRSAPPSWPAFPSLDPGTGLDILHCEISSVIADAAAIGGAVGSVAGAIAGGLIGAAVGCVILAIFTFGLGCLIAILIGVAIGAAAGLIAGNAIGAGIGWIAEQFSDFDKRGKAIERGCSFFITGSWVNDIGHQHNEIHDIDRAVIIDCIGCAGDTATVKKALQIAGLVGIGRHPQDRDP